MIFQLTVFLSTFNNSLEEFLWGSGLEDQLLGRVIRMEKSDLESERLRLVEDVLENKSTMKDLEDNLLEKLTSVEGSLVEDEELIHVLQETKATAEEV